MQVDRTTPEHGEMDTAPSLFSPTGALRPQLTSMRVPSGSIVSTAADARKTVVEPSCQRWPCVSPDDSYRLWRRHRALRSCASRCAMPYRSRVAERAEPERSTTFNAIVRALAGGDVEPPRARRRFGDNALRVRGKIFAMMVRGTFVAKLPRARVDTLVAEGVGTRFGLGAAK
jgi:hypothetical protein